MINLPNRVDLAWAAGLFEGEGCITFTTHPRRKNNGIYLQVASTDEDVLRRFFNVIKLGHITGPHRQKQTKTDGTAKKPYWVWYARGFEKSQTIIAWFWPWLGTRRRDRAKKLLSDTYLVDTVKYSNRGLKCSINACGLPSHSLMMCRHHYYLYCKKEKLHA